MTKIQSRIHCLKMELDALRSESEKRQLFINELKQEKHPVVSVNEKDTWNIIVDWKKRSKKVPKR